MGCFGGKSKKPKSASKEKKPKQKSWGQSEWKTHGRYLSDLSQPKKDYAQERINQIPPPRKVPLKTLKPRMDTLSRPRYIFGPNQRRHDCPLGPTKCHCHISDPIRRVPPQAKSYVPTERIAGLSQPKLDYQEMVRCFPRTKCGNRRVLTPGAEYRIKRLAMPKQQFLCTPDRNPYEVKPEALNAVATQRTVELAQPKSYSWPGII